MSAIIMDLGNLIYNYDQSRKQGSEDATAKTEILKIITENDMHPLYHSLAAKYNWTIDQALSDAFKAKNESELKAIDEKIEDATKNAGDTEVIDGLFSKARYLAKIGSWAESEQVYDNILAKPKTVTGRKIDAHMEKARLAFFDLDSSKLKATIDEAKRLNDIGGDWDRRNRLKIYEAHYLMSVHDLKGAAALLLDCVATFSCTELCTYNQFMWYALLTNLVFLGRTTLKEKIINDPFVITVARDLPTAQGLVQTMYNCQYKEFFETVLQLLPEIQKNRFLGPSVTFLLREYRVLAYAQFLESYKSVMLSSMASSFGISIRLLDAELSRFIAAGRLNAKIDKVGDIVETRRPDRKNAQYQDVIKKGDLLLNQIQKLVRAIDV